jgi:hypothetical protein
MFKFFLELLLFIFILIIIVKMILFHFHKIYFDKNVIKYKFNTNDLNHLKRYSNKKKIINLKNNSIFYSDYPWTSKNNNYIHDIVNDKYYIIDSGYYYYIPESDNFKIHVNKDISINDFDLNKYSNKIFFL